MYIVGVGYAVRISPTYSVALIQLRKEPYVSVGVGTHCPLTRPISTGTVPDSYSLTQICSRDLLVSMIWNQIFKKT